MMAHKFYLVSHHVYFIIAGKITIFELMTFLIFCFPFGNELVRDEKYCFLCHAMVF
jgi:hypothetical protein